MRRRGTSSSDAMADDFGAEDDADERGRRAPT